MEKERAERRKVRKRTKVATASSSTAAAGGPAGGSGDVEMSDATTATATTTVITTSNNEDTTTNEEKGKAPVLGGDLEDEGTYRAKEAAEFGDLVDSSLKNDLGCSTTGLYELVGLYFFLRSFFSKPLLYSQMLIYTLLAIVTHKGAAADSGHYIGFVKKSVFYAAKAKAKAPGNAFNHNLNTILNQIGIVDTNLSIPENLAALSDSVTQQSHTRSVIPSVSESAEPEQGDNGASSTSSAAPKIGRAHV